MTDASAEAAWLDDYQALTADAGRVNVSARTQVELTGDDRAKFLHNLCTNEIRKLAPLAGCEAFLTNVKGHIVAHGYVFSGPESLIFETEPGQAESILRHLDRYLIREKVELKDRSADHGEILVAGAQAESKLAGLASFELPRERLASAFGQLGPHEVWIRRVDWTGDAGFLIDCRRSELAAVVALLEGAGIRSCSYEALNAARIEAGTPCCLDITEKNLPQEVGRDRFAISFNKGCYLGQETIARIDALGHVNRTLVGVRFDGDQVPAAGEPLFAGEQPAGEVTSATYSPRLKAPLALAYVRRGSNHVGSSLRSAMGVAQVIDFPAR